MNGKLNFKRLGLIVLIFILIIVTYLFVTNPNDEMEPEVMMNAYNLGDVSEMNIQADTIDNMVTQDMKFAQKDFTLMDLEGNLVTLSEFNGEKVYIKYWASWCSICLAGLDEADQFSGEDHDFKVITIVSPDYNGEQSEADFVQWIKKLELKHLIVLLDNDGLITKDYGIRAYPTSVFIDSNGMIAKTIPGHMSTQSVLEMMEDIQ